MNPMHFKACAALRLNISYTQPEKGHVVGVGSRCREFRGSTPFSFAKSNLNKALFVVVVAYSGSKWNRERDDNGREGTPRRKGLIGEHGGYMLSENREQ
ncbi:hypothetical protein LXL04_002728 [Taraxacum kok-saghyz]